MPSNNTNANHTTESTNKTAMEDFLNAVFVHDDPSARAIANVIDRFSTSSKFEAINCDENAISGEVALRFISEAPSTNENTIAGLFSDKTKSVAALNFSSELPLSLVHSVLVNLGNWKVAAVEMNPSNGNLVVALYRIRFGYTIYIIPPNSNGVAVYTKSRTFLTEDEAIEYGDAKARAIAEASWAFVHAKPGVDWLNGTCRDSDEYGFVHENAIPGGSIGIKILRA